MANFQPDNNAPLLVFGGAYSNLQATQALFECADAENIPDSNILCTGDLVAYCAEPEETVNLIRAHNIAVVMGNCEESIGNDAEDCGCGFDEGSACDLLSASWYNYSKPLISGDNKTWMRKLPERISFTYAGTRFTAIHGGAEQNNQFIFSSSCGQEKQRQLETLGCDIVLAGHSGIPFGHQVDRRLWLNSGVIGMPANDGTPDGWFMVITQNQGKLRIQWFRLNYEYQATAATMSEKGLNNGYQEALSTGLWPSLDVLPDQEKKLSGQAIDLEDLYWPLTG